MKMKGTEIVVESLKRHKVDVMFGLPGGAIMPVYDVLYDTPEIKHMSKVWPIWLMDMLGLQGSPVY